MLQILIAILGLSLLVVIHEGGHFLVARLCRMRVERFSVGFGPPIASFKRGETVYQIAPIPFGGFVQITGLNPHEEFDHSDPYVYPNRPAWMRLATLVAGPAANYVAAVIIMFSLLVSYGVPKRDKVLKLEPNSPAVAAGFQPDDVLVEAEGTPLTVDSSIRTIIQSKGENPLHVKVRRGEQTVPLVVTPKKDPSGTYLIGLHFGPGADFTALPVGEAIAKATLFPVTFSVDILDNLWKMVTRQVKAELSGPIGIAKQIAHAAKAGALDYFFLIANLSVYLGLFNLLPVPALDGGRALVILVASVLRRRVNPKVEASVHTVGLVVLLGLMIIVSIKDVVKGIFGTG